MFTNYEMECVEPSRLPRLALLSYQANLHLGRGKKESQAPTIGDDILFCSEPRRSSSELSRGVGLLGGIGWFLALFEETFHLCCRGM